MDTGIDSQLHALATQLKKSYSAADLAKLVRLIEPTPATGEMSSDDFENMMNLLDATSSRRTYSPKSREAAKLFFVMGANQSEVSEATGLTIQGVNQLILRIRSRMTDLPAGWVSITVGLPTGVAKQVKSLARELLLAHQTGELPSQRFNIVCR